MKFPATLGLTVIVAMVIGLIVTAPDLAHAEVIFEIPNIPMTDGVVGDPGLGVSGTFTVPTLGTVLSDVNPLPNPTSVDLTVTEGASTIYSFESPSQFGYTSGFESGDHGIFVVDLQSNGLDGLNFIGITIANDVLGVDYSGPMFVWGYSSGFFSHPPFLATEILPTPEPATSVLLGTAVLFLVSSAARGAKRR